MQHYAITSVGIRIDMPALRVIPRRHWRDIVDAVAEAFNVPVRSILSTSNYRRHAWPRQAAYLILREERDLSLCVIGRLMKRDHGTVHHGIEAALSRLETDPEFAAAYREARRG